MVHKTTLGAPPEIVFRLISPLLAHLTGALCHFTSSRNDKPLRYLTLPLPDLTLPCVILPRGGELLI